MHKAFIFDMDGVIINSEQTWEMYGEPFYEQLFGKEIREKIGDTTGLTATIIHQRAVKNGFTMSQAAFFEKLDQFMIGLYAKSDITEDIELLAQNLLDLDFKLGLVSSSRRNWIDLVLPRIKFSKQLACIISITDRPDLQSKPHPDAYNEAIQTLNASPQTTIIIEDSNVGIQSAKASGAYVIGLQTNLKPDYQQKGADIYAKDINEVITIINALPLAQKTKKPYNKL